MNKAERQKALDILHTEHYSTVVYGKHTVWANKSNSGGVAAVAGTGSNPGYLEPDGQTQSTRTYLVNFPTTLPSLSNRFSIDFVPGAIDNLDYGETRDLWWGFTYSTRASWNKAFLKTSIVGEIYGTLGGAYTTPSTKPAFGGNPTITLSRPRPTVRRSTRAKVRDLNGGVMIFTPPFMCRGGCN